MSVARRFVFASTLALLFGCGGGSELALENATEDYRRQRTEIVGGTIDNGDPAVVALAVGGGGQYEAFCTGTLIGPRTVLTAAHCYYPWGTGYTYYVLFGTYSASSTSATRIQSFIRHPSYRPNDNTSLENDIAVVRLAEPVTHTAPIPINTTPLNASHVGLSIRHVGFGNTNGSTMTGSGTKRQVTYAIRDLDQFLIESGSSGRQTCTGDSGGPGFITVPGTSHEVVAGVVSFGDQTCSQYGYDTNVVTYASWIQNTMAAWETPSCSADGRCVAGCTPVDPDCACVADGVCSAQCADPDQDPDCPRNCGADGVCAQGVCPVADTDCQGEGQACTDVMQCLWRTCVSDPQHTGSYCSKPCSSNAECTVAGMECSGGACRFTQRPEASIGDPCDANTFCIDGACNGSSTGDLRCRVTCSATQPCPGMQQTCVQGVTGAFYCAEGSFQSNTGGSGPLFIPRAQLEGEAASSCSSTSGGPFWLMPVIVGLGLLRRRSRKLAALGAAGALTLVGCGPSQDLLEEPLGATGQEIVGGSINYGDPQVFMLAMQYSNGSGSGCTATLIGGRTLLTAAHCVDPRMGGANSVQIWATNATSAYNTSEGAWFPVVATRMHPGWNPYNSLDHDIALAALQTAPGVSPKPWNRESVGAFKGRPLRAVGYGITGRGNEDSGTKREVNLAFYGVDSTHIYLGDGQGKGICSGDSGGPSFHTFADGEERVVGVHSYDANEVCTFGADIRVDVYRDFITQFLIDYEPATCAEDTKCKAGCVPFDVDCHCVEDGTCNPQCPDLGRDPDCPVNCAANGICSVDECPVPDLDCMATGELCSSVTDCRSRLCVTDAQHATFYCSIRCESSADCAEGMECTAAKLCQWKQLPEAAPGDFCTVGEAFCTQGSICIGAEGALARCSFPCESNADCGPTQTCEDGAGNQRFCKEAYTPPVTLPLAKVEQPAWSGGCAAAGGLPAWLALPAVWVAFRRRGR